MFHSFYFWGWVLAWFLLAFVIKLFGLMMLGDKKQSRLP